MGFTLDDDEDDFWGDATTFGCARAVAPSRRGAQIRIRPRATLFKPAAARAPQPPRSLADGSPPRLHPRRAIDTLCKQAEEQLDLSPRVTPRPSRRASRPRPRPLPAPPRLVPRPPSTRTSGPAPAASRARASQRGLRRAQLRRVPPRRRRRHAGEPRVRPPCEGSRTRPEGGAPQDAPRSPRDVRTRHGRHAT